MNKKFAAYAVCAMMGGMCLNANAMLVGNAKQYTAKSAMKAASERHVSIDLNVLSSLIGYISGNVSVVIARPISLGLFGGYWGWSFGDHTSGSASFTSYNIGLQGTYAFGGDVMGSGWELRPFVGYAYYKATAAVDSFDGSGSTSGSEKSSGVIAGLMFNYQWAWASGMNMQLGLGPEYTSVKSSTFNTDGFGATFEYSIGLSI